MSRCSDVPKQFDIYAFCIRKIIASFLNNFHQENVWNINCKEYGDFERMALNEFVFKFMTVNKLPIRYAINF